MACDTHTAIENKKTTLQNGITNGHAGIKKKTPQIINNRPDNKMVTWYHMKLKLVDL
jgi:hypothetical protein